MEEAYLANIPGVKKKILAGGTGPLPHFPPGTKLVFHFQTLLDDFERTVIDDSRLAKRPAEIFVGKMFKMEIWESLLTSMRVGEVAEFWCDAIHTGLYPIVSKGMRLVAMGKDPLEGQKHMCGMGNLFQYNSTGYPELDELMRTPQPLVFIMELLQVGDPLSYQRESWMMEKDEKMEAVPTLHMQGNVLVKQGQFGEAAAKYKEAVLLLKTVQSREMPGDIDYVNLSRLIIPLELNYCQCMLELEEYYQVIEHATELLEKHKDCVKGYYKRAKAHAAVWNEKEARRDFHTVASLDATLAPLVHRELKALSERMKEKYWEEKEKYWNILGKENQGKIDEDEDEEGAWEKNTAGETAEEGAESVAMAAGDEGKEAERKGESQAPEREKEKERGANEEGEPRKTREAERAAGGEEGGSDRGAPPRGAGEDWQQMLRMVMFLQDEGNFLIKENRHDDASAKFKEAMEYVDSLQYKLVDRKGEDWESLEKVRLPLTLNLSQCMLELHRYRQVVELNSALLKKHKGNLKAVYQRARAHAALCNEDQARKDFTTVERLDPTFRPVVLQELKKLGENIRCLHARQNKTYWDTTHEKWGPGGASLDAAAATGAGKRTVTFAQKAEAAGEENRDEEEQPNGGEKPATADKKWGDGERGRSGPNVKMGEESKKKEKSGERVGGNKGDGVLVCVDGLGAPDNGAGDEDSHPTLGGRARDSAGNKRSGCDTSRKKVKCQSAVAQGPGGASRRNKASDGNKGNGVTQSESSNKSKLSTAALKAAGEAEEWEGEEEGGKREAGGTDKSKVKENDEQAAGAGPRTSTGKNDSAAKKSKRKHKKKLI